MHRPDNAVDPLDVLYVPTIGLPSQETVDTIIHQAGSLVPEPFPQHPLHRLAVMRNEQGISLSKIAKMLGITIAEARRQELETTDLLLSQLYCWRNVLETSIGDLLIEPEHIPTNPIKCRSQLVKMMKSVRSILETTKEKGTRTFAETLAALFIEMMPELQHITAWPSVGKAREQRDLGQAAYRHFDTVIARLIEE